MKAELSDLILAELRTRLVRLSRAASEAHAAATDPGSKAESKYDTRSLEESYLATGQAEQVKELTRTLRLFVSFRFPSCPGSDPIGPGTLVEMAGNSNHPGPFFLLAPGAGGMEIIHNGKEITLLGPGSPLHQKLIGLQAGDPVPGTPFRIARIS